MKMFKVLVFGDVVGKPGRKAIQQELPKLKKQYKPDLTILQAENLAHGYGITKKTLQAMVDAGVDFFTSGNHVFKNEEALEENFKNFPIIRPANYPLGTIGEGYKILTVGKIKVLVINLMGRVFFQEESNEPFAELDSILEATKNENPDIIIVDFHAEATSEKKSLGYYADGRVGLFFGSHTHVQTADEMILPEGTAFITDVGMVGLKHSSLGMDLENIIHNFKYGTSEPKIIPEHGDCIIDGIFAKINVESGKAESIERINIDTSV